VRGVRIALGMAGLDQCSGFDTNGNLTVTVDELIQAVGAALHGCSM
jgi:hypothetical protein